MSILTSVGMAISTLVLDLTCGGGGGGGGEGGSGGERRVVFGPAPASKQSDKGGLKEWVKNNLQALRRALAN